MEFLHDGLVYLLYTIYLLLVIVGFLTKDDMPQIGNLNLVSNAIGAAVTYTCSPMGAIPSKEAHWSETTYPELGRRRVEYAYRKADPNTGLVRHSFKVTLPTLKSVVTDPSGPFTPPPALDYVSVAELNLWVHPRSTEAERDAAVSAIMRAVVADATLIDTVRGVLNGQSIY